MWKISGTKKGNLGKKKNGKKMREKKKNWNKKWVKL